MGRAPKQQTGTTPLDVFLHYYAVIFLSLGLALLLFCAGDWGERTLTGKLVGMSSTTATGVIKLIEEIGFALIIAALLIFATETKSKMELTRLFSDSIKRIEAGFDVGIGRIVDTSKLANVPSHLGVSDVPLIERMGKEIYDFYVDGLQPYQDGFALNDTDWAVQSASILYRCLVDMKAGEVRVTHTGAVDIWCDETVAPLALQGQRELIAKGWTITRIFVGLEMVPIDADSKYRRAIDVMRRHGVKTGYVYQPNPSAVLDMTWLPSADSVMIWEPRPTGSVARVVVTTPRKRDENLDHIWKVLLDATADKARGLSIA